ELAEVVAEGDRRARHLALGTLYPGEGLARVIAAGAATAAARGAAREAAELGEHALRLTPPESDERVERMLRLASYLERVGERRARGRASGAACAGLVALPTRASDR